MNFLGLGSWVFIHHFFLKCMPIFWSLSFWNLQVNCIQFSRTCMFLLLLWLLFWITLNNKNFYFIKWLFIFPHKGLIKLLKDHRRLAMGRLRCTLKQRNNFLTSKPHPVLHFPCDLQCNHGDYKNTHHGL